MDIFPPALWLAMAALFGAVWGSFANVVIWRWPAGLSIVKPDSHCPSCGTRVAPYDNVPILSYFFLRARCRTCAGPISWRYPTVEASVAALSAAVFKSTVLEPGVLDGATLSGYGVSFAFCWALVVVAFIDLDTQLIPTRLTGVMTGVGLAAHLLLPDGQPTSAAIGVVAGFGGVVLFGGAYRLIRGETGIGGGDAHLMGMIGAFSGWHGALFAWIAGAAQFLLAQLLLLVFDRAYRERPGSFMRRPMALGPFLALGALEFYVLGFSLDRWLEPFGEIFSFLIVR